MNGWEFLHMMEEMRGNKNEEMLNHLIDIFKLDPSVSIKSMSLGDKRKLAVVSAFMNDPDVLILDEPTSGLDPIMQKVFIDFVIEEKKRGKTILLSSHIFSEVDATCDTISIIKDGKHVSTFKANDLKNMDNQTYILHFLDKENMDLYLNSRNKFKVVDTNEVNLTATIEFNKKNYHDFFDSLFGIKVKEFEEKPFTLQDYFMSFYKEEKEFGGLSGVKGNTK
jgi:ABC-2 type transport system ATP-binding protein